MSLTLAPCPHHSHGEPHDFSAELTPCPKCEAAGCAIVQCAGCDSPFVFVPNEPQWVRQGQRSWCSIACVESAEDR